jgi:putative transposase
MSDYQRVRIAGGTYFFTLVTFDRQPILNSEPARAGLREALRATRAVQPFRLDAICLLPEHLHCLWTLPAGDTDFSGRWNRIKGLFSKLLLATNETPADPGASRRRKGETTIWQRRFWEHFIRDDEDFRRHLDYLHFNPVKHGHVTRAADWPWSSFARYVRMGWYDAAWGTMEPESLKTLRGFGE